MNYEVVKNGQTTKGWARGRGLVDQIHFFTKRLLVIDGILEWDPVVISNLSVTFPLSFDYSEPKFEI